MNRSQIMILAGFVAGIVLLISGLLLLVDARVYAQSSESSQEVDISGDNSYCLLCHAQPDQRITLVDGNSLSITVDPQTIADSVHGKDNPQASLGCVDCHKDYSFPHTAPKPETARLYTIQQSLVCADCHQDQAAGLADGVHYRALAEGNVRSATCVDCHGSHAVQSATESRFMASQTCGSCHTTVYADYEQSVHGQALAEGDENVPGCVDCHGVHGIQHPTTALFRNRSPQLCADCHADETLMAEYDISTNVFNSYLTDFHGTTVGLFEQQDPNVATNKAVCYDCHGVHNITRSDGEKSQVVRENLLITCQQCHPDATSDFPDSWVGHFPPTVESHPLLFIVDLFYKVLIPLTLGGFIFLVGTDIFRRIRERVSAR